MSKTVAMKQIIKECHLEEAVTKIRKNRSGNRFFLFATAGGDIYVESTFSSIMKDVSRMTIVDQFMFVIHLTTLVPDTGDCVVLAEEHNGERRQVAMITRLKPPKNNVVSLLIT